MKRSITLFVMMFSVSLGISFSQQKISGKVTSAADKEPLPGVNVFIKGTTTGIVTNADGVYTFEVPQDATTLVFSFIGMKTQEIAIAGQSVINVELETESRNLEEIVVVGYGTAIKSDLTGSISKVSGDDLQKVPSSTFESTLQGKTSGVLMTSTTGKLGEAFNIRVRGTNSITASNQPLYVVDGMIISSDDFGINTNQPMNPLITLDPNDIESIQVLKDASAAAIYGSRGANGVVIITTKTGRKGDKSSVDFGYSFSTRQPTHKIEMLNATEYIELISEAIENVDFWGDGNYGPGDGERFIRENYFYDRDTADTDWQDLAFKDHAFSHEAYLNVKGGSEKSTYFAGVSYSDQEGILIKNNLKRINGRLNFDHTVSKYFDVSAKINYAQTTLDRVSNDNAFATPMQMIAQAPITPAYLEEDGDPNPYTIYFNSLLAAKYNKSQVNTSRAIASFNSRLHFIPKVLTLTSQVGIENFAQREEERQSPKTDDGQPAGKGSYRNVQNVNMTADNYLTFKKIFSEVHDFTAIAGISYQEIKYTSGSIQAKTFPNDDFEDLAGASENSFFSSLNRTTTYLSYFARGNYKLNNKYLLEASLRRDGSSRFGSDSRFGNFYAISGGWIVSNESFMENLPYVSFLKPRVSYGETGNAGIPDFGYMNLVDAKHYTDKTGFYAFQIGKSDLHWEKTVQLDLGLDFGFINNRISGEIDYYQKNTSDMLLKRSVPMTTGYTGLFENVGTMKNSGIEFVLNATPVSRGFVWNINFNITFNKNEVTKLIEPITYEQNRVEEGQSIGFFYMPEYAGVDPDNGDALYYTATGTTTNDYAEAEFRNVGSPHPDYFGGLSNSFSYKGFDLTVFFQFVQGNKIYRMQGIYSSNNAGWLDNQTKDQLDRWQKPGDITDVPQARYGYSNGDRTSSRYLEDGGYLRLKDVTLSYNLPTSVTEKLFVQNMRVYVSGLNLLTFTKFEGWDPEVTRTGTRRSQSALNVQQGVEYYSTPQEKGFTFGVNVTF
jgi:TonB-dependent starch-binding outer membrane protein SusC